MCALHREHVFGDAADDVINSAYGEFNIMLSKNGYVTNKMRTFVQNISTYAKGVSPGFIVIPQNGEQLLSRLSKPKYDLIGPEFNDHS